MAVPADELTPGPPPGRCRHRRLAFGSWHPGRRRGRAATAAPSAAGRRSSGSAAAASARPGAPSPRSARADDPHHGGDAGRRARPCRSARSTSSTPRPAAPGSASSTGCSAAAWCPAPSCCSPASPASASPPCCSTSRRAAARGGGRTVLYVSGEESAAQVRHARRADRGDGHDACTSPPRPTSPRCSARSRRCSPTCSSSTRCRRSPAREVEGAAGSVSQVREVAAAPDPGRPRSAAWPCCSSATSPRTARSPARACSSTSWTSSAVRGRPALAAAPRARGEEPLRPDRRGRLLRPVRRRHRRARRPERAVPLRRARDRVPAPASPSTLEGRRPLLAEVQALVAPSDAPRPRAGHPASTPRGWRCCSRCSNGAPGARSARSDVYVSTVGGVRLTEPAADLAIALRDRELGVGRARCRRTPSPSGRSAWPARSAGVRHAPPAGRGGRLGFRTAFVPPGVLGHRADARRDARRRGAPTSRPPWSRRWTPCSASAPRLDSRRAARSGGRPERPSWRTGTWHTATRRRPAARHPGRRRAGHRAARRPRAHPARPHRRPDRARLRQGRRVDLHRRLPARRRVLRDPAARAGQDGRRHRPRPRRHPHPAGRHPAGARPDASRRQESGTRHRTAERVAKQTGYPGDLGEPVDADHRALRRRPAPRPGGLRRDPVPRQPGPADPRALQGPPRRGHRHPVGAGDRGPRHRPRRRQRAPAPGDGPPDQRGDRRLRRRARRRRPAARPPAGGAHRRPRQRPRAGHPRLPAGSAQVGRTVDEALAALDGARPPPSCSTWPPAPARSGFTIGGDALDSAVSPRGYRLLAKVPRLPGAIVDRLVEHFGGLQKLLAASIEDLRASTASARAGPAPSARACPASPSRASSSATSDRCARSLPRCRALHGRVLDWYAANARDLPWRRPRRLALGRPGLRGHAAADPGRPGRAASGASWLERWPTPARPRRRTRPARRSAPGAGSATRAAPCACTRPRRRWWSGTTARCPTTSRRCSRCPASAPTPRPRWPPSPSAQRHRGGGHQRPPGRWPAPSTARPHAAAATTPPSARLAEAAAARGPRTAARAGTVAVMELGALVCTARAPRCDDCPLLAGLRLADRRAGRPAQRADAGAASRSDGTDRQARGALLAVLRDARRTRSRRRASPRRGPTEQQRDALPRLARRRRPRRAPRRRALPPARLVRFIGSPDKPERYRVANAVLVGFERVKRGARTTGRGAGQAQPDDRDDRLHHRPGLDGLADADAEVLLHQPEPGVVDVAEEQRAGADREDQQRQVVGRGQVGGQRRRPCRPRRWWRRSPSRSPAGCATAISQASSSAGIASRWTSRRSSGRRRRRSAVCLKPPPAPTISRMPAIGARDFSTVLALALVNPAAAAQREHADDDGGEQRDQRRADDVEDPLDVVLRVVHDDVDQCLDEHQDDGQQDRGQGGAEAGRRSSSSDGRCGIMRSGAGTSTQRAA